ncbi:hypothetical protein BDR07DRAFT_1407935 [Suillus spraguei]|nr:hypothetical protein BDR07DRAFT_1407935 [Suillus spraguei]
MEVSCSPAKQRPFIEALITCMGSSMPPRLRHAALRAICSSREVLASIDVVDDADMVLTNLSRAILTAVCPQPDVTPTNDSPDCFFYDERDLCYLKLIFSLARNSYWRPHLHCQMDRAIRMIEECCNSGSSHTFYLIGFFLRMRSEEVSATSLSSINWFQLRDMCLKAWYWAFSITDDARCVEFLPVLVEETKEYEVRSGRDREQLVENVERLMRNLERHSNQGDVEKLRSMIKGMF